jgi:hypothetical protein
MSSLALHFKFNKIGVSPANSYKQLYVNNHPYDRLRMERPFRWRAQGKNPF